MYYFFRKGCLLTAVLCIIFFTSKAQKEVELAEVTISAPKFQEKLSRSGKVVSILDSAQIAQSTGKGIVELLQSVSGIQSVGSRSAWGANQELYVRGSNTGQVLLLMDGFPLNDPSHISQVFDWNLLDLRQVNRIEILKGGQSTLYGSDAMAGVINIVTNQLINKKRDFSVSLTGGAFGYIAPSFSLQEKIKSSTLLVSGSMLKADGFSAAEVPNGEADGFQREQIRVNWSIPLSDKWDVKVGISGSRYKGSLDAGPFTDDTDYTSRAQAFSVNGQLKYSLNRSEFFVRFFSDFSKRRFVDDSTFVPKNAFTSYYFANYAGLSQGVEIYGKSQLMRDWVAVYGLEYRRQHASQSDFYYGSGYGFSSPEIKPDLANQHVWASFVTLQKNWNIVGIEVGGRMNRQSSFGNFSTFSLNPYVRLGSNWKIFGNVYTGFKIPSLYQLYSAYGNGGLMPEKSNTIEGGIQFKNAQHFFRLVYFNQQVADGIGFQSKNEPPYGQYVNINRQNSAGIELEASKKIRQITLTANYTLLNGKTEWEENAKIVLNDYLLRRPRHQISAQFQTPISKKIATTFNYQFVGERTDLVYDEATYSSVKKELAAYHWMDIAFTYQLNNKWNFNVLLKNALNQKIVELYGYNGMPPMIMGGIRLAIY